MTKSGRYESSTGWPLRAVTRMSTFPTTWEEKKKRSVDLTVATDAALDRFRALPGAAAAIAGTSTRTPVDKPTEPLGGEDSTLSCQC